MWRVALRLFILTAGLSAILLMRCRAVMIVCPEQRIVGLTKDHKANISTEIEKLFW